MGKANILPIITVIVLIGLFFGLGSVVSKSSGNKKTDKILATATPVVSSSPAAAGEIVVREADLNNKDLKSFVVTGCGTDLAKYKFSVDIPGNWIIKKGITNSDKFESDYQAAGDGKEFYIGCTTLPVSDGTCDSQFVTTITVGEFEKQGCYGEMNGSWNMGILTLPKDEKTNSVTFFSATGIEPDLLTRILGSYKKL